VVDSDLFGCNARGCAGQVVSVEANRGEQPSDRDVAAFEALFRRYHDDLCRFALRRVHASCVADVVAQVFLVAWRRRADVPPGDERAWLFGVAVKVAGNELRAGSRRARLRQRLERDARVWEAVADTGEVVTTTAWVRAVLATLPAAEQEALRLTEWDQLDAGEAARVAGCSRGAFRVRLHRARRHMAARLSAQRVLEVGSSRDGREVTTSDGMDVIL
jgi:RNA polymerase sigma factor (sigma-70 family)